MTLLFLILTGCSTAAAYKQTQYIKATLDDTFKKALDFKSKINRKDFWLGFL